MLLSALAHVTEMGLEMGSRLDLSYMYLCLTQRIAKNIVCYGQIGNERKSAVMTRIWLFLLKDEHVTKKVTY